MAHWILSSKDSYFRLIDYFNKYDRVDWVKKLKNINSGDIVFIYSGKPIKKILFKTVVEEVGYDSSGCLKLEEDISYWYGKDGNDDNSTSEERYFRLKLVEKYDTEYLSLAFLLNEGLKAAPQKAILLKEQTPLLAYIKKYANVDFKLFPDEVCEKEYPEGSVEQIIVNRYERNLEAREDFIKQHKVVCEVCGFDFYKTYGELGKNFIHIHHIKPLSTIKHKYKLKMEDLVPVCPNCHAMLHHGLKGDARSVEELKEIIKNNTH